MIIQFIENLNIEGLLGKKAKTLKWFFYVFSGLFLLLLIGFYCELGPFYTTDTVEYLKLAQTVKNGFFPHSAYYSPGFSLLIGIVSRLFGIKITGAMIVLNIVLISSTFLLLYQLIKKIDMKGKFHKIFTLFSFFFLFSHWAILRILLSLHADALFMVVLLFYFLFLYNWLKTFQVKWLVLLTLISCLGIWVKYNGLILIPFIMLMGIYYGKDKFNRYILILPAVAAWLSYTVFKIINGGVIKHLEGGSFTEKLLNSVANFDLMLSNFTLTGITYFGALFTMFLALRIPRMLGFIFICVVVVLFAYYFIITFRKRKSADAFLFFSVFYSAAFYALCQFTNYEEINVRTLFPAVLSLLLWLVFSLKVSSNSFKYAVYGIMILNVLYSFFFVLSLQKADEKNTFYNLLKFENRESVQKLKELDKIYHFEDRIYTNEFRNLYMAMDFRNIRRFPSKVQFAKGKFREIDDATFGKMQNEFCQEIGSQNTAVLLVDCAKDNPKQNCLKSKDSKVFRIGSDLLILTIHQK